MVVQFLCYIHLFSVFWGFFSVCLLNRFKSKYHPEEYAKRQEEIRASLRNRLKVFLELQSAGRFNNVSVDVDKTDEMLKVLDAGWFNDCLLGEIYATVRCIQLLNKRPEENGRCPCYSCNSSSKWSLELCYHITSSAHYTQDVVDIPGHQILVNLWCWLIIISPLVAVIKMEGGSDIDLTVLDQPADKDEGVMRNSMSESQPLEKR